MMIDKKCCIIAENQLIGIRGKTDPASLRVRKTVYFHYTRFLLSCQSSLGIISQFSASGIDREKVS